MRRTATQISRIEELRASVLSDLRKEVDEAYAQMGVVPAAEYADLCRCVIARMSGHCSYLTKAEEAACA